MSPSEITDTSIVTLVSPPSNISIAWVCHSVMATQFWRRSLSKSLKLCLSVRHHVHIWQVSPQLSCDDKCQIWTWFKGSNRYFSDSLPVRYIFRISKSLKLCLSVRHHVHIWQVSTQLSCDDKCQIWTWFKGSNWYFSEINTASKREINERVFNNCHPWSSQWISRYIKVGIELTRTSHPLALQSVSVGTLHALDRITILNKALSWRYIIQWQIENTIHNMQLIWKPITRPWERAIWRWETTTSMWLAPNVSYITSPSNTEQSSYSELIWEPITHPMRASYEMASVDSFTKD